MLLGPPLSGLEPDKYSSTAHWNIGIRDELILSFRSSRRYFGGLQIHVLRLWCVYAGTRHIFLHHALLQLQETGWGTEAATVYTDEDVWRGCASENGPRGDTGMNLLCRMRASVDSSLETAWCHCRKDRDKKKNNNISYLGLNIFDVDYL